jgi:aminomethyltransferase
VSEAAPKKTPLYDEHVRRGARIAPFSGWLMPVQYTSIVEEHQAVRNNVGIFDISHMGQFLVRGAGAGEWLNWMLTNNIGKLEVGTGQYTFLLNESGGIIDDLIVYRIGEEEFLLVVNAARSDEDFDWLKKHREGRSPPARRSLAKEADRAGPAAAGETAAPCQEISLVNRSADFGGVAIQGPRVVDLFYALLGQNLELPPRNQLANSDINGMRIMIARTGYTGEDGVEAFFRAEQAAKFWNLVLDKGAQFGINPCGLGARDTLRLEMCYPLNGSDLSPEHNPLEAGLGFFVDLNKTAFIGRDVLQRTKENGPAQKLVPFRMEGKGPPPRPHYAVFSNGERVGEVTSGTLSPSLNYGIGMAYLSAPLAKIGTKIDIEIRGHKFPATVEKKPLYKKS